MTVEERREGGSTSGDKFPVGLRVLAVDDDRVCLKLLDGLLRRCQYHVTTSNQAIDALNLLRSEKGRFDLVISDVHMPDMDGFKLLELVGLEMDLPVIMLSANSDPKSVMKGITHGACDYLLKPVRLEELKNIWQHVVRRKKFDCKDTVPIDGTKSGDGTKLGRRKRNDSSDGLHNDNDESEEDVHDNIDNDEDDYDSSSSVQQKKPRVVWSVDLHRKFVAAVHHLGIDKAMPKRILDLMNVQKLTRENVASHLQKYRLYLKRISTVSTTTAQQQQSRFPNINASLYLRQDGRMQTMSNYNSAVGSGFYNNNLASSGIIQHDNHNLQNLGFSVAMNQPHPNLVQEDMPSSSSINLHHYRNSTPSLQMNRSSSYDSKFNNGKSFHENPSNNTPFLPQPHNLTIGMYPKNNSFGQENNLSKSKNAVVATFPEDFQRVEDVRDRDISFGSNPSMSLPAGALSISNQTWQQRLDNDPIPITNSTYGNNINVNPITQVGKFGNGDGNKSMMDVCTNTNNSNSRFIDDIPTTYTENCNNIEMAESSIKDEQFQWNFTGEYEPFDDLINTIAKQVEDIW